MWTKNKITIEPWQMIPDTLAALNLTAADGMTQVWFVQSNGHLSGGAAAVNEAMANVWWARPFTYLYRLPGIKQLQDRVYRWVADNRYRLPGSPDLCAVDTQP